MRIYFLTAVCLFFFVLCGNQGKKAIEERNRSLTIVDSLFGADFQSDSVFLASIEDFVMDSAGCFWIIDSKEGKVKVFDENLNYLKSIGDKGEGPGEFNFPRKLYFQDDDLYVISGPPTKIHSFKKDGEYRNTIVMEQLMWEAMMFNRLSIGGFLRPTSGFNCNELVWRFDDKGKVVGKYGKIDNPVTSYDIQKLQEAHIKEEIPGLDRYSVIPLDAGENSIYVIYHYPPKIEKYNLEGVMTFSKELDLNDEVRKNKAIARDKNLEYQKQEKKYNVYPYSLYKTAIVHDGKIYLQLTGDVGEIIVLDSELNRKETIKVPANMGRLSFIRDGLFYFLKRSNLTIYRCR